MPVHKVATYLLLLCVPLLAEGPASSKTNAEQEPVQIVPKLEQEPALIVAPERKDVVIENAVTQTDHTRQVSVVNYTVAARTADVRSCLISVYVVYPGSYIKGGEGWQVREAISSGSSRQLLTPLGHYVPKGGTLVIVLKSAETSAGSWSLENSQVLQEIRKYFPDMPTAASSTAPSGSDPREGRRR
jgi:hypothetical protein